MEPLTQELRSESVGSLGHKYIQLAGRAATGAYEQDPQLKDLSQRYIGQIDQRLFDWAWGDPEKLDVLASIRTKAAAESLRGKLSGLQQFANPGDLQAAIDAKSIDIQAASEGRKAYLETLSKIRQLGHGFLDENSPISRGTIHRKSKPGDGIGLPDRLLDEIAESAKDSDRRYDIWSQDPEYDDRGRSVYTLRDGTQVYGLGKKIDPAEAYAAINGRMPDVLNDVVGTVSAGVRATLTGPEDQSVRNMGRLFAGNEGVPTIFGNLKYIPEITGNPIKDLELVQNPIVQRDLAVAAGELGTGARMAFTASRMALGVLEFGAFTGAVGLAGKAARGAAGLAEGTAAARAAAKLASNPIGSFAGRNLQALAQSMAAGSKKVPTGINFDLREAAWEAAYGGFSAFLSGDRSVLDGIYQEGTEGVIEIGLARGARVAKAATHAMSKLGGRVAGKLLTAVSPNLGEAVIDGTRRMFRELDATGIDVAKELQAIQSRLAKKGLSSTVLDNAARQALSDRMLRSHFYGLARGAYEKAWEVAFVSMGFGGWMEAARKAAANGEDWDKLTTVDKIGRAWDNKLSPEAVATGMGIAVGSMAIMGLHGQFKVLDPKVARAHAELMLEHVVATYETMGLDGWAGIAKVADDAKIADILNEIDPTFGASVGVTQMNRALFEELPTVLEQPQMRDRLSTLVPYSSTPNLLRLKRAIRDIPEDAAPGILKHGLALREAIDAEVADRQQRRASGEDVKALVEKRRHDAAVANDVPLPPPSGIAEPFGAPDRLHPRVDGTVGTGENQAWLGGPWSRPQRFGPQSDRSGRVEAQDRRFQAQQGMDAIQETERRRQQFRAILGDLASRRPPAAPQAPAAPEPSVAGPEPEPTAAPELRDWARSNTLLLPPGPTRRARANTRGPLETPPVIELGQPETLPQDPESALAARITQAQQQGENTLDAIEEYTREHGFEGYYRERVPLSEIKIDPERFQYKVEGINRRGVSSKLKGEVAWRAAAGRGVILWEDLAGQKWVADGHHRFDLARRLGREALDGVIVFREADGVTPADMRIYAAAQNIASGNGTSLDAARLMREQGWTVEDFQRRGFVPTNDLTYQAAGLSQLSDALWAKVVNGEYDKARIAELGWKLPGNDNTERQLQLADKVERLRSAAEARDLIDLTMALVPTLSGDDVDMFGNRTSDDRFLIDERVKLMSRIRSVLAANKNVMGYLLRNDTLVKQVGQIDEIGAESLKNASARVTGFFAELATKQGNPINKMVADGATEIAKGADAEKVARRIIQEVQNMDFEAIVDGLWNEGTDQAGAQGSVQADGEGSAQGPDLGGTKSSQKGLFGEPSQTELDLLGDQSEALVGGPPRERVEKLEKDAALSDLPADRRAEIAALAPLVSAEEFAALEAEVAQAAHRPLVDDNWEDFDPHGREGDLIDARLTEHAEVLANLEQIAKAGAPMSQGTPWSSQEGRLATQIGHQAMLIKDRRTGGAGWALVAARQTYAGSPDSRRGVATGILLSIGLDHHDVAAKILAAEPAAMESLSRELRQLGIQEFQRRAADEGGVLKDLAVDLQHQILSKGQQTDPGLQAAIGLIMLDPPGKMRSAQGAPRTNLEALAESIRRAGKDAESYAQQLGVPVERVAADVETWASGLAGLGTKQLPSLWNKLAKAIQRSAPFVPGTKKGPAWNEPYKRGRPETVRQIALQAWKDLSGRDAEFIDDPGRPGSRVIEEVATTPAPEGSPEPEVQVRRAYEGSKKLLESLGAIGFYQSRKVGIGANEQFKAFDDLRDEAKANLIGLLAESSPHIRKVFLDSVTFDDGAGQLVPTFEDEGDAIKAFEEAASLAKAVRNATVDGVIAMARKEGQETLAWVTAQLTASKYARLGGALDPHVEAQLRAFGLVEDTAEGPVAKRPPIYEIDAWIRERLMDLPDGVIYMHAGPVTPEWAKRAARLAWEWLLPSYGTSRAEKTLKGLTARLGEAFWSENKDPERARHALSMARDLLRPILRGTDLYLRAIQRGGDYSRGSLFSSERGRRGRIQYRRGTAETHHHAQMLSAQHLNLAEEMLRQKLSPQESVLLTRIIRNDGWSRIYGPKHMSSAFGLTPEAANRLFGIMRRYVQLANELGRELVEFGVLAPEQLQKHYGKYLQQVWLSDRAETRSSKPKSSTHGSWSYQRSLDPSETHLTPFEDFRVLAPMTLAMETNAVRSAMLFSKVLGMQGTAWVSRTQYDALPAHLKAEYKRIGMSGRRLDDNPEDPMFQEYLQAKRIVNAGPEAAVSEAKFEEALALVRWAQREYDEMAEADVDQVMLWNYWNAEMKGRGTPGGPPLTDQFKAIWGMVQTGYMNRMLHKDLSLSIESSSMDQEGGLWGALTGAQGYWRQGKTVMSTRHWAQNLWSFLTNDVTGKVPITDVVKGMLTGKGYYADAARAITYWTEAVKNGSLRAVTSGGRSVSTLPIDYPERDLVLKTDHAMRMIGSATFVENILQVTEEFPVLEAVRATDPEIGVILDELEARNAVTVNDQMVKRMQTPLDRFSGLITQRLGSMSESDAIRAIKGIRDTYGLMESWHKLAATFSKLDQMSKMPGGKDRSLRDAVELAALSGAEGTADYASRNPYIAEWTNAMNVAPTRRRQEAARALGKENSEWAKSMVRAAMSTPFLIYPHMMMPAAARAALLNPVRTAGIGLAATATVMLFLTDEDERRHALLAASAAPGLQGMTPEQRGKILYDEWLAGSAQTSVSFNLPDSLGYWDRFRRDIADVGLKMAMGSPGFGIRPGPSQMGQRTYLDYGRYIEPFAYPSEIRAMFSRVNDALEGKKPDAQAAEGGLVWGATPALIINMITGTQMLLRGREGRSRAEDIASFAKELAREWTGNLQPGAWIANTRGGIGVAESMMAGRFEDVMAGIERPGAQRESGAQRLLALGANALFPMRATPGVPQRVVESQAGGAAIAGALSLPSGAPPALSNRLDQLYSTSENHLLRQLTTFARDAYEVYLTHPMEATLDNQLLKRMDLRADIDLTNPTSLIDRPQTPLGQHIAAQPKEIQRYLVDRALGMYGDPRWASAVTGVLAAGRKGYLEPPAFERLWRALLRGQDALIEDLANRIDRDGQRITEPEKAALYEVFLELYPDPERLGPRARDRLYRLHDYFADFGGQDPRMPNGPEGAGKAKRRILERRGGIELSPNSFLRQILPEAQ